MPGRGPAAAKARAAQSVRAAKALAAVLAAAALWAAAGLAPGVVLSAGATTARTASLGGAPDFFTDEGEVQRWCASLAEYPDLLVVESGRWDLAEGYGAFVGSPRSGPGAGLHFAGDRSGRWGVGALYFHARESDSDPGSLHGGDLASAWTGIYARRCGPLQAGLRLRHVRDRLAASLDRADDTAVAWLRTRQDVGLGGRMDLGAGAFVDLAGEVRRMSDAMEGGLELPSRPDAGQRPAWRNFAVRSRVFVRTSPRTALVPVVEYLNEDFTQIGPWPGADQVFSTDRRAHLVRGGLGWNFFPDLDKFLLLSGEYLRSGTALRTWNREVTLDRDLDLEIWAMRAAGESRLGPWLVLRAGAGLERRTDSEAEWSRTRYAVPLAVGLGLCAGRFALDLALCDREPGGLTRRFAGTESLQAGTSANSTWFIATLRCGFGS